MYFFNKRLIIYFSLILYLAHPLSSEDNLWISRINEIIEIEYKIVEHNILHQVANKEISNHFFKIFHNHSLLSQEELDSLALDSLKMFYEKVTLGHIEDSQDGRRQSIRAAMLLTSIAFCSQYSTSYYLDLAIYHLMSSNERPIEFLEKQLLCQYLIGIEIYLQKDNEYRARLYLDQILNHKEVHLNTLDSSDPIRILVQQLDEALPVSNK